MRHSMRALIGGLVLGACLGDTAAADSDRPWWPFGRGSADAAAPSAEASPEQLPETSVAADQAPSTAPLAEDEPAQRWMIDSPLTKVSWPRLQFPEVAKSPLPRPWPKKSEAAAPRNAWAEEPPITPEPTSPMQAVTDGARRVGDSTRAAWHKTIDVLTPGGASSKTSSRVARRDAKSSWWGRMLGAEDEKQGPQTIPEWMAQERLDP
jgi:hypothetical protein